MEEKTKPISKVGLIQIAISGQRGRDQQRIAEEGLEWLVTLLKKNADYGSSVWKAPILTPGCENGTAILARMSDKISRLNSLLDPRQPGRQVEDESVDDTIRDLGAYCLLYLARPKDKQCDVETDWE